MCEKCFFFSFIPAISYYSWALPYCTPPQANQESREVQIFFLQYTVCVAQGCVILNSSPCCIMECFDFLNKTRRCFIAPCDKVFPIPCQRVHEFIWILFRNAPFEIWFKKKKRGSRGFYSDIVLALSWRDDHTVCVHGTESSLGCWLNERWCCRCGVSVLVYRLMKCWL